MSAKALLAACAVLVSTAGHAQLRPDAWFDTWKLRVTTPGEPPETLVYSDAGGGAMRMESVEAKSVLVTRMDGKPSIDIGANGNGQPTLAVQATSPTRYRWTFFRAGKPFVQGVNTLAPDGTSFEEVSWRVDDPKKTVTLHYDRR